MENQRWFGALVERRRRELGLTRAQMRTLGGPSDMTMGKIERGEGQLTHTTLVRIDQSLGWPPGASGRILARGTDSGHRVGGGTQPGRIPAGTEDMRVGNDSRTAVVPGTAERPCRTAPADERNCACAPLLRVPVDFERFFAELGFDAVVEQEKALVALELDAVDEQFLALRELYGAAAGTNEQLSRLSRRREELEADCLWVEDRFLRDVAAYTAAYATAVEEECRRLGVIGPIIVENAPGTGGDDSEYAAFLERLREHARRNTPLPGSAYGPRDSYATTERYAAARYRERLRSNRSAGKRQPGA